MNRLPHSFARCRPPRLISQISSIKHQSVLHTLDSVLNSSLQQHVQHSIQQISRKLHHSTLDRRRFDQSIQPTIDRIVNQALDQAYITCKAAPQAVNHTHKSAQSIRHFSSLRSIHHIVQQSINHASNRHFSSSSDGSRGPSMALPFAPLKPATDDDANDPLKAFSQQRSDPIIDSTKQPELALNFPALNDLPPPESATPASPPINETPVINPEQPILRPTPPQSTIDSQPTAPSTAAAADVDAVAGTSAAPAAIHDHHATPPSSATSAVEQPVDLGPAATDSHSNMNAASTPTASATATTVPAFLRPAELSILDRIRLHPLFQLWPNIGYIISACATLVSDILWLRSLLICANFFGIAVNYKFNFWTGIYWNIFFIFANLVQILLILFDRRGVVMNEEEQALFDQVFSESYSPQEFRKLLQCGEFTWLDPGTELMKQGHEIHDIYLIAQGTAVVDEETKVRKEKKPAPEPSVIEETISRSPSLLSYVFGAADDDQAHGLMTDAHHPAPTDDESTITQPVNEPINPSIKPSISQPQHESKPEVISKPPPIIISKTPIDSEPVTPDTPVESPAPESPTQSTSTTSDSAEPVTPKKKKKTKKKKKRKSISTEPPLDAGPITADETDMELQIVRLGMLGPGRLVGEMSLLSSVSSVSGGSSSAGAVAKATVTCADRCRVLKWPRDKLRVLFFKHPSLAVGWYSIVSTDLVTRLSEAKRVSSKSGYRLFLLGCCGEGSVTTKQKAAAEEYRRLHGISSAEHEEMLHELGWSDEDWARGSQRVSWLQSLRVRRLLD